MPKFSMFCFQLLLNDRNILIIFFCLSLNPTEQDSDPQET